MKEIRILLADDHQIVLDGLQTLIEKNAEENGIQPSILKVVAMAHNGEEVLKLLETISVDVVVLDIRMPVMDGLTTALHIRKQYPDTKIILLTMHSDGDFIMHALRTGVHGYVVKEKSSDTLIQVIRQVLLTGNTYYAPDLLAKIQEVPKSNPLPAQGEVPLTSREKEIICYMVKHPNETAEEIGQGLHIAAATVQAHLRNARSKLELSKSAQLIMYAVENNLCN